MPGAVAALAVWPNGLDVSRSARNANSRRVSGIVPDLSVRVAFVMNEPLAL